MVRKKKEKKKSRIPKERISIFPGKNEEPRMGDSRPEREKNKYETTFTDDYPRCTLYDNIESPMLDKPTGEVTCAARVTTGSRKATRRCGTSPNGTNMRRSRDP